MASFSLCDLPGSILSDVLSRYCDGRSISTFSIVAQGNSKLKESRFSLVRDALVYRYIELSKKSKDYEEIRDVLDVIRENIRMCEEHSFQETTSFPGWCAIVDYFESQTPKFWMAWIGPIETQHGVLENAVLRTDKWTPGALQYWYNDFELFQFSLVPPVRSRPLPPKSYGWLEAPSDLDVMERITYSLNHEYEDMGRYSLVPRHMDFDSDPSICFTLAEDDRPTLKCYWEDHDDYDWEEAVDKLGENVIRIMNRRRIIRQRVSLAGR